MPTILRNAYGKRPLLNGHMVVTPTTQKFVEGDGTDVRLDRIRLFDHAGNFVRLYLQDKMGRRFSDNLPNTADDLNYLKTLSNEAKK